MALETYVRLPGRTPRQAWHWKAWVPGFSQIWNAARLNLSDALDPFERGAITLSMRQGMGLIVLLGLLAGLLPLLSQLWLGLRLGAAVPLASLAVDLAGLANEYGIPALDLASNNTSLLAGSAARLPPWLAASLSSLGLWINVPLRWLSLWLVYGTAVAGVARLMGAKNQLQTFFAATSLAAVPLVLTGLAPLPLVGPVAVVGGALGAGGVYCLAVRFVTRLDWVRLLLALLLPGVVVVALSLIGFLAVLAGFALAYSAL